MKSNKQKIQFCKRREIVITKDGSHTMAIPEQEVTYHSVHGAVAESKHVFIEGGLNYLLRKKPDE
jgi:hypothetical protein